MNFLSVIPTLLTLIGDLPVAIGVFQFLLSQVAEVEKPGVSGQDKLDSVLNATEVYINTNFPAFGKEFTEIATGLEQVVGLIVEGYNLFAKPAAKTT